MRKRFAVPAIYALADEEALGPAALVEGVSAMVEAGVRWVQVRSKRLSDDELLPILEQCVSVARRHGASLWINDRVDLAAIVDARGVHLGQRDLPPRAAREIVGKETWIGRSTHSADQFLAAEADRDVDLIALGPVFGTTGKADAEPTVGLELLRELSPRATKPLVAIGGITAENLAQVLEAGADAVAVLGAACRGDVKDNCQRLISAARSRADISHAG